MIWFIYWNQYVTPISKLETYSFSLLAHTYDVSEKVLQIKFLPHQLTAVHRAPNKLVTFSSLKSHNVPPLYFANAVRDQSFFLRFQYKYCLVSSHPCCGCLVDKRSGRQYTSSITASLNLFINNAKTPMHFFNHSKETKRATLPQSISPYLSIYSPRIVQAFDCLRFLLIKF